VANSGTGSTESDSRLTFAPLFCAWNPLPRKRVAVEDYFASSHYVPKDQFSITVTRNASPAATYISFSVSTFSSQSPVSKCDRWGATSTSGQHVTGTLRMLEYLLTPLLSRWSRISLAGGNGSKAPFGRCR
jgi:hypothetical protein